MLVGQRLLETFFNSVQFQNPDLAESLREDVRLVSLYGLTDTDKGPAREAAERLRVKAFDLPVVFERTLASALQDLGF